MRIDRLFDAGNITRIVSLLLLLSLLGLADGYLLVRIARSIGTYLALALEGATALVAILVVGGSVHGKLVRIRRKISYGSFPGLLYAETLVLLVALGLLLAPGFVSDGLGVVLFVLPIRTLAAWTVTKILGDRLEEAHEYLKMRVFTDRS